MGNIQGSINQMIGTVSHGVMAVKGFAELKNKKSSSSSPQQQASEVAMNSANNAIQAKTVQKRNFMDYLKKQTTSVGKVGDLPESLQKQIASQYTQSQRKKLMDKMDKEVKK